jgi:hypothetical protein
MRAFAIFRSRLMPRKLVPLFAALAVCAAATAGVIATTAHAQNAKPLLVALTSSAAPLRLESAAPPAESAAPAPRMRPLHRGEARDGTMCRALYAREVGELAYQGAMLNLTRAQQPLFDRWQQVRLDVAHRRQATCESRIATRAGKDRTAEPDPLAREQDRLKTRLADLAAERPALDALTNALTPAQKRDFQPDGALGGPGGMRGRRFARMEPPPGGPMNRPGPMDEPGMAPPPVPPH